MHQEIQLNQVIEAALVMLRKTITQHTHHFTVFIGPKSAVDPGRLSEAGTSGRQSADQRMPSPAE
ncbi:hypothetical protein [Desulfonatronum thiosulfatophilum]|uniref:hypothetical protein n=1 Tax=Desulfonatronum thiosulfatophilum TaxID=617002 RepID=UPI001FC98479|nr:hypothetical protein [Desulfonatronum thiosulfatophilum]